MRVLLFAGLVLAATGAYAQAPPEQAAAAETAEPQADAFEVAARVHTRWTRGLDDPEHPSGDLTLPRARLSLEWRPSERVEGELGADFAPVLSGSSTTSELLPQILDAFVAVETAEWLTLRAGHRKVPFSGGRLVSLGDLRPVRRGEYVGFLSADDPANLTPTSVAYAGRKLGLDLQFEVRSAMRLSLDLAINQGDRGAADPGARIGIRPVRGLRVFAAVAALRSPDSEEGFWAAAYELDVLFERWGWRGELEAATGENWLDEDRRSFRGGYALVAYDIPVWDAHAMSIEPLVRAERLNQTVASSCDEVTGLTGGATLHALEVLRLQLNLEHLDHANDGDCRGLVTDTDETRLFVQVAFDVSRREP